MFFVPDNSELFRNELINRLSGSISQAQLRTVLDAFDVASSGFDISRRPLDIISVESVPEVVKWFIASKAVANLSPKTLVQYRDKLIRFFDTVRRPFQDITANDIRLYLYQFKTDRNVSDRYLENIRITLNGFFSWLVDNQYLLRNPCATIEHIRYQEKPREPLSSYELEVVRWSCADIREKALVDFLFSTGCRVSECAFVRLSDVDFDNRSVRILRGKGGKSRTVYFNAESELTLRKYLEIRTDHTDALFVSVRAPHQPLKPRALEIILHKISERAGLHVYPHKLRHTYATAGLRGGMPLEKLQALMGHARPETTLIYAKLDQMDLQREHSRVYS